ncbi:hypothetical protein [Lysinibacillus sp. NPDC086135]|uniref:hypothetical protein n=1 Tax=Lysinibacillus sp. NPDC086135 TaxID=3364130 RepID=UPI0037FE3830
MFEREFKAKLEEKIKEYEEIVFQKEKEGLLKPSARKTYLLHANNFIRWCNGEFVPGDRNKNKNKNKNKKN